MKLIKYHKKYEKEVDKLVKDAFAKTDFPTDGEIEVSLIHEIREGHNYIPEYEFLAMEADEVVGHCMISMFPFEDCLDEILILTPVSVKVGWQNKGIGTKMLKEALKKAKNKKFFGIIVEGNPKFYHRFGFITSTEFGICASENNLPPSPDCLMAMELIDGGLDGFFGEVDYSIYKSL